MLRDGSNLVRCKKCNNSMWSGAKKITDFGLFKKTHDYIVLFFFDEPKKRNFHIFLDFWTFRLLQDSLSPANHTPCTQTSPGTLPDLSVGGRTGAGRHGSALGLWGEVSGRRGREGAPWGSAAGGRKIRKGQAPGWGRGKLQHRPHGRHSARGLLGDAWVPGE